jgi:hypothetical protein
MSALSLRESLVVRAFFGCNWLKIQPFSSIVLPISLIYSIMATAVIYVLVLALLILSSVMLFRRALNLLSHPKQPDGRRDRLPYNPGSATAELTNSDEIVEMLERKFHSSPSIDL